jgi:heme oxygenase
MHNQLSQTPTVMSQLKSKTTPAHKQLELTPCLKRLFAGDYTIDEYASLLSYFYSYFNAIEPLLFDDIPAQYQSQLAHRRKIEFLQKDLLFLNVDINQLTACNILPPLDSFAKKMGAMYVLEGSLLGGRIIGQHLKNHFDTDMSPALNFYSCYGANLDTEWRNFATLMVQCFDSDNQALTNEVIESANATFLALQQWLEWCSAKKSV